jgi:hypothetical protein
MDDMLPFGFIDDGRDDVIEQLELPRGNWLVSDIENEFL